ncbi:MAG: AAA family ATPase [Oscillospiraceae bacterium]|nr:AAA family ATPase [Oscillospiraceae bacterium]
MNIKQAKQEIFNTLRAYLQKDELGNYRIPALRQRPILLMGPPGIGKTQIMEQIAAESGVGLVAYTITHHTRQSAVGLPFIEKKTYGGQEYAVTEYTMSEILASVHELMERTGIREGLLFLDEINCVSETLAPMMLQFLQCKTFGNQSLPEGWVIVAAGNPPEYNKSVREFDVVTLDRVKRIDVAEDYGVWKEYALRRGLHGAILSYLDIKKDHFYRIENTVEGLRFASARGWEDLSEMLYAYESLSILPTREMIGEYIQLPEIAKDFANYLDLFYKYREVYHVEEILAGTAERFVLRQLAAAPFDERLSVMGLLMSRLAESARAVRVQDELCGDLHASLLYVRGKLEEGGEIAAVLEEVLENRRSALQRKKDAGQLDKEQRHRLSAEIAKLEAYAKEAADMDALRALFGAETARREDLGTETGTMFDNAFRALEDAFGDSQELVIFVTEITAGYDTAWFVENFGCDAYFRHNRDLLFDEVRHRIREDIKELRKL